VCSELRQVPDTQEAFVDAHSDMSLILELLEREDGLSNEGSARFFFQDLAEHNEARNAVVHLEADLTARVAPNLA
jgi:hypothetical protein